MRATYRWEKAIDKIFFVEDYERSTGKGKIDLLFSCNAIKNLKFLT